MKSRKSNFFAASVVFLCSGAVARLEAGRPLPDGPPPTYGPLDGTLTLELGFTANEITGRGNLLAPIYRDPNQKSMFFLDGNWSGNGDANENASGGLGFRHRFDDPDVILGINGFYDSGDYSGRGYDQFGAGFELLSKWFDFRANGYFASYSVKPFGRSSSTDSSSSSTSTSNARTAVIDGPEFFSDGLVTTTTVRTHETSRRTRRTFDRQEGAMPGLDLETGGLVPYLDRWAETRVYVGYAYFEDPFGNDISCFTARLECRPVPALVFDAEYKGDSRLVDGDNHWFFSARVEIPFDLSNLLHGQSPFAGITEAFTPQGSGWGSAGPNGNEQGDKKTIEAANVMRNRMNEQIVRNWRPIISRTGPEEVSEHTSVHHQDRTTIRTVTVDPAPEFTD